MLRAPDSPARRIGWHWPLATAGVALAVYLRCLPPTVTGEDAGELIVAALTLGVPHPPGYPTWTLLAHVFTWLPMGTVAWRVALFSAVCAAACAGLLSLLVLRIGGGRLAAVAAGLALAFSFEFWEQALIPEVYTLNLLFLLALVLLLDAHHAATPPARGRLLAGAGLLYGLGLGVHPTLWALGPVFAAAVIASARARGEWAPRRHAAALVCVALGACVYLYLPWASARNPPVDWGNPETLQGFWDVVTRKQFAFMPDEHPRSAARYARQLGILLGMGVWQFTLWVGAAGLLGLVWTGRRAPRATLLIAVCGVVTTAAFAWAQNFPYDAEWLWVMSVFQLPLYLAVALGIGGAVAWARTRHAALGIAAAAVAVASPLAANFAHNDRADHVWVEAHARAMLDALPPNAILIPGADHETFPAIYLQVVEGHRTDVTLGRKYGHLEMGLWSAMPGVEAFGEAPPRRHEAELIAWLARHGGRPVYVGQPPPGAGAQPAAYVREGLLHRVHPLPVAPGAHLPRATPPRDDAPLPPPDTSDFTGRLIRMHREIAWADVHADAGRHETALGHLRRAAAIFPADPRIGNHLGVWCARRGYHAEAAHLFRAALTTARRNLRDDRTVEILEGNLQRATARLQGDAG